MGEREGVSEGSDQFADGGLRLSELFSALEHRYRRYVLYILEEEESTDLQTLAARVAAWERGRPVDDGPEETTEQIQTSLYHKHLPRLSDAALIEYDSRSEVARYRHPHPLLDRLLRIAKEFEKPPT